MQLVTFLVINLKPLIAELFALNSPCQGYICTKVPIVLIHKLAGMMEASDGMAPFSNSGLPIGGFIQR